MKMAEFKKMTVEERKLKMAQAIRFKMKGEIADTQLDAVLEAVSTKKQYTVTVAVGFEEFLTLTRETRSQGEENSPMVYSDLVYGDKNDASVAAAAIVERVKPSLKYGDYVENIIVLYNGNVSKEA